MAIREMLAYILSQRWIFCTAAVIYALGLMSIALREDITSLKPGSQEDPLWNPKLANYAGASVITSLYQAQRLPIDAENFTGLAGEVHSLPFYDSPDQIRFTRPLGKKLLILDVDNRPLDGPGGILNSSWTESEEPDFTTVGRLSHYIYARIHGYDYKLVQMPNTTQRHATWSKVTAISEALRHYPFVVFLDADTMFPYPHVPLEWLFNYWEISAQTLVALAEDPNDPINQDDRGKTLLNTGFIIAQQSPRTQELFEAWDSCADDIRYPGCSVWKYRWPHEQGAFGSHVRYEFSRPRDVRVLPCAEANGCPGARPANCSGKLVRHYWYAKAHLPAAVRDSLMRYLVLHMHGLFLRESGRVVLALNGSQEVGE